MELARRVSVIVSYEGIAGLFRRTICRLPINSKLKLSLYSKVSEKYYQLGKSFNEKALAMGHGDLRNYLWYHTVDLGNGLITPGNYDYRRTLPSFKFPTNMQGMNVLDVGSATGFFSFEFEKRGANVISVELPSIADWDMSPEDREQTLQELMSYHQVSTIEELQHLHLDGPFEFCRKVLNSKVKRYHSSIYDLSARNLRIESFDVVFVGDVLLHIFSPLKALAALAPLCHGTLVISQQLPKNRHQQPLMLYVGGDKRHDDNRTWWLPNKLCFEQILSRVGFKSVSVVGYHSGMVWPEGYVYNRAVIHAKK
jgi:tRNA (mo5U34)-methyltransferase